jgi:1,4-alpha-glucan branching enzyme
MDFVFTLHSHLPYVLNHGRWPHGTDWISEAAIDTYLPLIESLSALDAEGVRAPVTIGLTPVLANQLASDAFRGELELFFEQRLAHCEEAPASLRQTGDAHLIPLVDFWRDRLTRLRALFRSIDRDIVAVFRALESRGRLETIGSAATHGFLPLLSRDESIQLQLDVGQREHRRLFGQAARGCWVPECAYRPRGPWKPLPNAPDTGPRPGIEEYLAAAGFEFFFVDAHMARAGSPLGLYGQVVANELEHVASADTHWESTRTPYRAYRVTSAYTPRSVAAFIRDPESSAQVWSRHQGYPGDGSYLEFHKIRWPGGLKLWRVTRNDIDLGLKEPYDPPTASAMASAHGAHFASLLATIAATLPAQRRGVVVAPFDTELFGHWWHEGPEFLGHMYRALRVQPNVRPVTASQHLAANRTRTGLRLATGSRGANGHFSMCHNPGTARTCPRIWGIENRFWTMAREAIELPAAHEALAQAARELLLVQSSDWQFIISTGAVADYAVRRFNEHADACDRLFTEIEHGLASGDLTTATNLAVDLRAQDDLFPNVLESVRAVLAGVGTAGVRRDGGADGRWAAGSGKREAESGKRETGTGKRETGSGKRDALGTPY